VLDSLFKEKKKRFDQASAARADSNEAVAAMKHNSDLCFCFDTSAKK
jgi:hypothetical protein